jgi:FAD/FMN-containing dehydrogenase
MYNIQKRQLKALEWMLAITGGFPISEDTTLTLMMTLLGAKEEVDYANKVIKEICLEEGKISDILPTVKETRELVEYSGPKTTIWGDNMMLMPLCSCVPTLRLPLLAEVYGNMVVDLELEKYNVFPILTAFGCDNVVVASPILYYDQSSDQSWKKAVDASQKIFEALADKVGFTPHYIGRTKSSSKPIQKLGTYYELLKSIKKFLDPNNIMNPGQLFMPKY